MVIVFQQIPEPKAAKNRLHLDVEVTDLAAATTTCVARGAKAIRRVIRYKEGSFQLMLRAEGNDSAP